MSTNERSLREQIEALPAELHAALTLIALAAQRVRELAEKVRQLREDEQGSMLNDAREDMRYRIEKLKIDIDVSKRQSVNHRQ